MTSTSRRLAPANGCRSELLRRQVHGDVLKFCTAELVKDDYFHAVLEATKSVSQKIRDKTGLTGDGGELATKALALGQTGMPFLAFNSLRDDSEKSEQWMTRRIVCLQDFNQQQRSLGEHQSRAD